MKFSAMKDSERFQVKGALLGALLLSLFVSGNAQPFRAAALNERKPVTGMISSLFGGIMNAFQDGNSKMENEIQINGRGLRDSLGRVNRHLSSEEGIFINAGSSSNYTDPDGIVWISDKDLYDTGKSYSTSDDISNTDNPTIYQSERWRSAMTYSIPVTSGVEYDVYLHFAEIYKGAFADGARVFDVYVESDLVADDLDIYKMAGGGNTAYIVNTKNVVVNDGLLTINLIGVKQNAKINAIEIRPSPKAPSTCEPVPVNFDKSAAGVTLKGGRYVANQWQSIGMILSTVGGLASENRPRLFNTSSVGNDPDLGSPNEFCTPPGPGVGLEGQPGGAGPNCDPLGNVLIVQSSDESITIPDDAVGGGSILIDFTTDVSYVGEIGLLDIDYETMITVSYYGSDDIDVIDVPLLGDNSVQTISIEKSNVKQVRVDFTRSGAVTFISFASFCSASPPTVMPSSVPSRSPSESPSESPTAVPSASPSESPSESPSRTPPTPSTLR